MRFLEFDLERNLVTEGYHYDAVVIALVDNLLFDHVGQTKVVTGFNAKTVLALVSDAEGDRVKLCCVRTQRIFFVFL